MPPKLLNSLNTSLGSKAMHQIKAIFWVGAALISVAHLGAQASAKDFKPAPPRCADGAPHPNAPKELAQFGFLIGDFAATIHGWTGDGWSDPRSGFNARWNGWYGLGGMAIIDEWYQQDPATNPDAVRGINIRTFDKAAKKWRMSWISTGDHRVLDLSARMEDGVLTMTQDYPAEQNPQKSEFNIVSDDEWERVTYGLQPDGSWGKLFKIRAVRIGCPN